MMSEGNGYFDPTALLGPKKLRFADVQVNDLGKVRIRSLTEGERSRIESAMKDKKGNLSTSKMADLKCRLIVECVVDSQGNQVFKNADIDQLRQQDAKITNDIVTAIQAHCGFSDDDLEDIAKN